MTSKAGETANGDSDFMTEDFYQEMVRANIYPSGQQGVFGADYIHPARTTHALVANGFLRLFRERAFGNGKSDDGLLDIKDEKAKDPWKPIAERGATP